MTAGGGCPTKEILLNLFLRGALDRKPAYYGQRDEQAFGLIGQLDEVEVKIEIASPLVDGVDHNSSNPDGLGQFPDFAQGVVQEDAAHPLPLEASVESQLADQSRRYPDSLGESLRILGRKVLETNLACRDRVITPNPGIIGAHEDVDLGEIPRDELGSIVLDPIRKRELTAIERTADMV
jgi:hypothetical protein